MTEPQTWTVIGVLAATLVGFLGVIMTLFTRTMRAEFATVRAELRGEIGTVRGEIGTVRGEIASLRTEMNLRFESVEKKVGDLDRDVHILTRRALGLDNTDT